MPSLAHNRFADLRHGSHPYADTARGRNEHIARETGPDRHCMSLDSQETSDVIEHVLLRLTALESV